MSSPTSVEQIINQALDRAGYPEYIGNIYEGTKEARAAINVYAQTRDQLLRDFDWGFAEKIAAAALSGQTAPAPWAVEYTYPSDCIKLRSMFNATYTGNPNNPLPVLWTIGNSAAGKIIWANLATATLIYTEQVINPAQWEPDFTESLIAALAVRLDAALKQSAAEQLLMPAEQKTRTNAEGIVG